MVESEKEKFESSAPLQAGVGILREPEGFDFAAGGSGPSYLQVPLPGVLHVLHGAAVDLLQTLLPPLVLRLQLVQLHPQVLSLLAELVLQLLQRRLRLGQLHLQTLLQQGDLERNRHTH
ncbi:hypothetical protein EYF80_033677 [Liparis tanakae]|uniref:Uncharacterized protein n=1 Tax=Liparis tanakae TaxID=230148 RepID=A0A4Z2GRC0_9TELE|nr:hypothetical protein EYF80_033677 [Liparis tanakae]